MCGHNCKRGQDAQEDKKEAPKSEPAAATSDAKPADAKPADDKTADSKPAADKPAADKKAPQRMKVEGSLDGSPERDHKSNQRLLDSRNEKITAARKKVQELNARFADWYYLIDDASFKQLMLKRDVLIGPKTAAGEPGAPSTGFGGGLPPNINFGNPQ